MKFDLDFVNLTTNMNYSRIKDTIDKAGNVKDDIYKKERLDKQECKSCFYIRSKIGGASMTRSSCAICNKSTMYGSTCIDILCEDCAKAHKLCKHCGGDMEDRNRRKL